MIKRNWYQVRTNYNNLLLQ